MKKSDLKTGMIVQNVAGGYGKVLRDTGTKEGDIIAGNGEDLKITWYPMKCLPEDLGDVASSDTYSIIKVWAMDSNMNGASLAVRGELLWTKPKPVVMKLTDTYDAEVSSDFKTIRVGCQTIKVDTVRDLLREIDNTKD